MIKSGLVECLEAVDRPLFKYKPFVWTFCIAIGVAAVISFSIAWVSWPPEFCFEHQCWNRFFTEVYKIPFSILGIGIVVSGLVATVFRSGQAHLQLQEVIKQSKVANTQMQALENQNKRNLYYEHIRDFEKRLAKIEQTKEFRDSGLAIRNKSLAYDAYFPDNRFDNFSSKDHAHSEHITFDFYVDTHTTVEAWPSTDVNLLDKHVARLRSIFDGTTISEASSGSENTNIKLVIKWIVSIYVLMYELGIVEAHDEINILKWVSWDIPISCSSAIKEFNNQKDGAIRLPSGLHNLLSALNLYLGEIYWFCRGERLDVKIVQPIELTDLILRANKLVHRHPDRV